MTDSPRSTRFSVLKDALALLVRVLSSFGLATVVLLLFLLITFLGTLEQVEHGLYDSQRKYFESMFVWGIDLGGTHVPVVLPGGGLLLVIFFINMVLGALRRIRKAPGKIGVLIAHLAMVFLLLSSFVEFLFKKEGNLALFEGQTSDEFQSYHESVIEIERTQPAPPDGKRTALVIPGSHYEDLAGGRARTFTSKDLPFDLTIQNYLEHCGVRRATEKDPKFMVADGYVLQERPLVDSETGKALENERKLDGAYVRIREKQSGIEQNGILWRAQAAPYSFQVGNETYSVNLTRRSWRLPFAVRLEKFEMETHPGTERARKFTSHVSKITPAAGGDSAKPREEKRIITMNAPLREGGNVLFQASFSQDQAASGVMTRSVFAVVRNPSDNWPLWALVAASAGLLIHMAAQLSRFLVRSRAKRPAPSAS